MGKSGKRTLPLAAATPGSAGQTSKWGKPQPVSARRRLASARLPSRLDHPIFRLANRPLASVSPPLELVNQRSELEPRPVLSGGVRKFAALHLIGTVARSRSQARSTFLGELSLWLW